MSPTALQLVTGITALTLIAAIVLGLVRRGLYRASYAFPAYLGAVLAGDAAMLLWPSRFYTWTFWQSKETLYAVLKLAIALELTVLAYQSFPSAAAAARRAILAALALALGLVAFGARPATDLATLARDLQPRLAEGTVLVFGAVWGLALWYHLPLHRLHKAILRGLVPYLLVFTVARGLISSLGWHVWEWANAADTVAYLLVLAYWTWEAWRTAPPESDFLRELQPWRARL